MKRREWDSNPRRYYLNGFQDRRLRPLGHPSSLCEGIPLPQRASRPFDPPPREDSRERREWDSNPRNPIRDSTVFETVAFVRSAISP